MLTLSVVLIACGEGTPYDAPPPISPSSANNDSSDSPNDALLNREEADADEGRAREDTTPLPEPEPEPEPQPIEQPPPMLIGTWNLRNFSPYGVNDFRIEDIASHIEDLAPDVLALQELKVKEGSEGEGTQAWDALLGELEGYQGLINPYNPLDSVVGLIYNPEVVSVVAYKSVFVGDWWPFPRAPLEATLRIEREERTITVKVIVLHLKAFPEGADRREEACKDLHNYLQNGLTQTALILGDFNDNPLDPPEENVFLSSFLDNEPTYDFLTADLPLGTVTSLGYQHLIDGVVVNGEFLDHGVATERLHISYTSIEAEVVSRPYEEYDWYEDTYSDHFPLLLHFTP